MSYTTTCTANTTYGYFVVDTGTASSTSSVSGNIWYNTSFWGTIQGKSLEQNLKNNHVGMLLNDFLQMWQKDNYRIVLLETKELEDGQIAKRYNVYSEEVLNEYGNHLGFVIILDRANRVLRHEIFNVRGD